MLSCRVVKPRDATCTHPSDLDSEYSTLRFWYKLITPAQSIRPDLKTSRTDNLAPERQVICWCIPRPFGVILRTISSTVILLLPFFLVNALHWAFNSSLQPHSISRSRSNSFKRSFSPLSISCIKVSWFEAAQTKHLTTAQWLFYSLQDKLPE